MSTARPQDDAVVMLFSQVTIESEHHRRALLDDADNFRLARLARAARRTSRAAAPPTDPPQAAVRARPNVDTRNSDADCRYAVSR